MSKSSWRGRPVRCKVCSDVIYSKYRGEYVTCKCGAISIDQTPEYTRGIGDYSNFEFLDDLQIARFFQEEDRELPSRD